jgi:uncharacterized OB-fold protein
MAEARKLAAPSVNAENKPYFDAAAQGRLLIKRCAACGKRHFYPRALCPHCFSERTEWQEAKGTGMVYSYSVVRSGAPYVIAYVALDEGVTMLANVVDCDPGAVRIGLKVKVIFQASEGGTPVPMFMPA